MEVSGQFLRYILIGVFNTAIHGAVMAVLVKRVAIRLALANATAFFCAVTFSFFANAYWTFTVAVSMQRYLTFVIFMGCLAYVIGFVGDRLKASGVVVFFIFVALSMTIGFAFSRHFVFFGRE